MFSFHYFTLLLFYNIIMRQRVSVVTNKSARTKKYWRKY